jgi:hypothetical protein
MEANDMEAATYVEVIIFLMQGIFELVLHA